MLFRLKVYKKRRHNQGLNAPKQNALKVQIGLGIMPKRCKKKLLYPVPAISI